jgi:hypothetical protein
LRSGSSGLFMMKSKSDFLQEIFIQQVLRVIA